MSDPRGFGGAAAEGPGVTLDEFIGRVFRLGVSLPLLVVAVVFAVVAPWLFYSVEMSRVVQEAEGVAEHVEGHLSSLTASLVQVAALEGLTAQSQPDATARRLEAAMAYSPSYVELGRADANGLRVATVPSSLGSGSVLEGDERVAFDWVMGSSEIYRGSPRLAEKLGGTSLIVAVRVITPQNEFAGMVWAEVSLAPLGTLIAGINEGRDEIVYILDGDGSAVIHPEQWRVTARQRVSSPREGIATGIDGYVLMGLGELELSDQTLLIVVEKDLSRFAVFFGLALVPLLMVTVMLRISHNSKRRLVVSLTEGLAHPVRLLEASVRGYDAGDAEIPESTSEIVEMNSLANAFGDAIRRLESTTEALEASNRDLERFATVAAHDLKEPIRKVLMYGGRLTQALGDDLDPDVVRSLDRMVDGADRMDVLVDDILEYSRIGSGMRVFEPTALSDVVAEVVDDLESTIADTGGRVEVGTLPTIDADSIQMSQLFGNLLDNSLKYARPGVAPIVSVTATTERIHGESVCRIVVADNGIGFDQQHAKEIFDVFRRLVGRSEFAGTGIGLAICRRIVERHGGTIEARGSLGVGSQIEFVIPVHQKGEAWDRPPWRSDRNKGNPVDAEEPFADSEGVSLESANPI